MKAQITGQTRTKSVSKKPLFGALLCLACIIQFIPFLSGKFQDEGLNRILHLDKIEEKPVMHTFFERLPGNDEEEKLLRSWTKAWEDAGFETRILSLNDARKHPSWTEIRSLVNDNVGREGNEHSKLYNEMCYYRWFAMATIEGGGWMSDFDTFPLNFPIHLTKELPNGGRFTSQELFVPSLMSASKEEWNRVAMLVVDAINDIPIEEEEGAIISDMYSLRQVFWNSRNGKDKDVHEKKALFERGIASGYNYSKKGKVDCDAVKDKFAAHLSHSYSARAIQEGTYPIKIKKGNNMFRAEASYIYMKAFRKQCKNIPMITQTS
mmetsp:Transcript_14706/g.21000  ORF Transcript_14706/g.21000 Transcript_14706/m.21000 type:complete len:322 (+) Transcript_14706:51-1016(+)